MNWTEILKLVAAIFGSIGGAGIIIFALSNWLGKVWAVRLMQNEKAEHDKELEKLRSKLESQNQENVESVRSALAIFKETHLKEHTDKIAIYRSVIDIIAAILAELEKTTLGLQAEISKDVLNMFSRDRLRAYGYLGMLSPQSVMDAQDALVDRLHELIYEGKQAEWSEIRNLALNFINEVRKDIGINKEPIEYRGSR